MARAAARSRSTKETSIDIRLEVDGLGATAVDTGLPFFDHKNGSLTRRKCCDLLGDQRVGHIQDVDRHGAGAVNVGQPQLLKGPQDRVEVSALDDDGAPPSRDRTPR